MMKILPAWLLIGVMALSVCPSLAVADPTDTVRAQIIYVSNRAVYFNAGAEQGVTAGWRYAIPDTADTGYILTEHITEVYPEISSAEVGDVPDAFMDLLHGRPAVRLFPDSARAPYIPLLRVGVVATQDRPSTFGEICDNPLLISLFHPEVRRNELGWPIGYGPDTVVSPLDTLLPPDTMCWSSRWLQHDATTWIRNESAPITPEDRWTIDTIRHVLYDTFDDQAFGIELGEVDLAVLSISDLLRAGFPPDEYEIQQTTQHALVVFGVNQRKRHLRDNRLTTAVSYLISKEDVIEVLLAGQGVPRQDLAGLTQFTAGSPYPYNPQQGYELLRKVKIRDPLWFGVDSRIDRGMTVARHIAEKLNLSDIETSIIELPPDRWRDPATLDSLDAFLYRWDSDRGDPGESLARLLESPLGREVLASGETVFDDMRESPPTDDLPAREAYYSTLEFKLLTEPYLCPLYQPIMTVIVSRELPDIRLTPYGEIDIVPENR